MKTLAVSLLILILAVSTATAGDGPRWYLTLTDDSRIVITPQSPMLRVGSDPLDAIVSIPTRTIRRVESDGEQGVVVELANGDRISGGLAGKSLAARALIGRVDILPKHIRRIEVIDVPEVAALTEPAGGQVAFPVLATAKITDKPYGRFCVADSNGDRHLDFAVSDKTKGSESVDVYLNDGEGSLIEKASYPVGNYPQHIVAGDFNEDGDVDLIVPVYHGSLGDGTMHLLTGNGDGTFEMGPAFSPKVNGKGLHPNRMAVDDLNKDGHLDFVVEMGNDWAINIHWGKGDGTFTPMYTCSNGQNPGNTKICDLNNDSWPDIVSGSQYTSLYVHLSDLGDGYKPPVQYLKGTSRRQPIIVGDLDGDEDIDVLCAHYTSPRYVSVMINDGNGVFTEKGKIDFPDGTGLAKVTDFDFDGKMDFVLGSGNDVLVVPGNGDGTFKKPVAYDMGHKVGGLQLHDLNHDGRLDLVYIDYDNHKVVMRLNATLPSNQWLQRVRQFDKQSVLNFPVSEYAFNPEGLILYYNFEDAQDGQVADGSGKARHGKAMNMKWADKGRIGKAAQFDGEKTYIDLGADHDLPSREEYTISVWFLNDGKGNHGRGYGQKIFDKTVFYHDFYLAVKSSGRLAFQTYEGSAGSMMTVAGKDYRDNRWHHCLILKKGTKGKMYVDGKCVSETDQLKKVKTQAPFLLGYSKSSDELQRRYWSGMVDEFMVYDRALPEEQIMLLYLGHK